MTDRRRLDQYLADQHLQPSRARARDAVLRGAVRVNGAVARKPGMTIGPDDRIEIADPLRGYVSRAALKLKAGLAATGFSAEGRTALDLGASTGGFTQVLLEAGAARVIAVDVGHGQMAPALAGDRRVRLIEGLNARELEASHIGWERVGCVVCDVSFISLRIALPPALAIAAPGSWGLFLVKPQFEVGRQNVGGGGVVRDRQLAGACAAELAEWLDRQPGWHHTALVDSPVEGGGGNREFILAGVKN